MPGIGSSPVYCFFLLRHWGPLFEVWKNVTRLGRLKRRPVIRASAGRYCMTGTCPQNTKSRHPRWRRMVYRSARAKWLHLGGAVNTCTPCVASSAVTAHNLVQCRATTPESNFTANAHRDGIRASAGWSARKSMSLIPILNSREPRLCSVRRHPR